jgi:bifunctional DNA-binding transcriptional regulator/antitoxin component of YhaV-PrlF toxin-antitoxin module
MERMDWRTTINAVNDRVVVIPIPIANDMGLKKEDYLKLEYDEIEKKITLMKVR